MVCKVNCMNAGFCGCMVFLDLDDLEWEMTVAWNGTDNVSGYKLCRVGTCTW